MAHYAFIDENNIVTSVIVGVDENDFIEGLMPEEWYSKTYNQKCIRTSYNGNIRKNYAGIGYTYNDIEDVFIPPKPIDGNWVLNQETYQWEEIIYGN